jgi:hypothetical protein
MREKKTFVAQCTSGCVLTGRAAERIAQPDGVRRFLEQHELYAHDDKHVSPEARSIIRMLRELPDDVYAEVVQYTEYCRVHGKPAFAQMIKPVTL